MKRKKNKTILLASLTFILSLSSNAQELKLNESSKKYEVVHEIISTSENQNSNFDVIEEWLATNYANKYSSSRLSNKDKGTIMYNAAFETKLFPSKGLISFNYVIKFEKNKINFFISEFGYTIIGASGLAQAFTNFNPIGNAMTFESKNLGGKKKIFAETENHLISMISKIKF